MSAHGVSKQEVTKCCHLNQTDELLSFTGGQSKGLRHCGAPPLLMFLERHSTMCMYAEVSSGAVLERGEEKGCKYAADNEQKTS